VTAEQLIRAVEESGGSFKLEGSDSLLVRHAPKQLAPALRKAKPEIVQLLKQRQFVYLDVPCTCSEKPYPHFRHRDGTGPGSGRKLDPNDPRQA
jgi:hypothetical protein